MNLIQAFINNPVKVAVGVLLIVLFGFLALDRMPMQLTPEVQLPTLTIETVWPGASPQEIEREIVLEQEEVLKGVEGLKKMSAECYDSRGSIILEFTIDTDMQEALLLVNSRLQQVPAYPEDADEPVISTSNSSDRPIAWIMLSPIPPDPEEIEAFAEANPEFRDILKPILTTPNAGLAFLRLTTAAKQHPELDALIPHQMDVSTLRRFAEDNIEARFERVEGVSNSNVFGGREEEMQVIIDPEKLAARSLTISDVRRAIRERNQDTSAGDFSEDKRRWVVRTLGQLDSPEEVMSIPIAKRGGRPVYVRDVAEVELGYKKAEGVVRRFGQQVIAVNCLRQSGANILDVMAGIRGAIDEMNQGLLHPRGLQLTQVYDETEYIYSSIDLVRNNILVGGFLTICVLLIFLRSGRSTLVIGLAIPTSIIGTFLFMALMGRSLNVISLAGLAFAVGMLVDNAVVVLENIYRHYQEGMAPRRAALVGVTEVWGAVLASTLTTLAVFLPVLFVQEEAGQLFRDIAIAISGAVALSLLASIVLIPTAAARILKQPGEGKAHPRPKAGKAKKPSLFRRGMALADAVGRGHHAMFVNINAWIQRGLLRQLAVIVLLIGGAVVTAWAIIPKVEYLPTGNRNLVFGILLPPPGYNLEKLEDIGKGIEQDLRPYWDVDYENPPEDLEYPIIGDFFYVTSNRQVFLGLRAHDPSRGAELVDLIQSVVVKSSPGTFGIAKQASLFEQGLTSGRTIDIEITGPELERLIGMGQKIMGEAGEAVPNAQLFPRPSLEISSPEVHVIPDWEKAADMQVTAVDLGYEVNALVDGAYADDYFLEGDKIDLVLMGEEEFVARTQDLGNLALSTPAGGLVPLNSIAQVRIDSGPEQINRRERQRAITIQVTPPETTPLEDAMDAITTQIVEPRYASGELGGGYRITLSGTADKLRDTWLALRFNFILAVLITYLLMAALFESWLYPFVVILSVPLGAVGGLIGLRVVNLWSYQSLDVLTMLGFVILVGTVVNNAILIVHQALNNMRERNLPVKEAILDSVRTRVRPIFMTTTTTVFGLSPLVLFPGAGSELYRGLGSVVLGGLLISAIFTLVLIPTVFLVMMNLKNALIRILGRGPAKTAQETA